MADYMRRHRVRWLGHAARKPNDVVVKQLLFVHSIPGHPRPLGRPHLTWMDTAMHDMGSLGRTLQIDLPQDWALYRDVMEGGGQPGLSFEQCFILSCSFPVLFVFVVGGLGFELCVFVAGWRHALRSE